MFSKSSFILSQTCARRLRETHAGSRSDVVLLEAETKTETVGTVDAGRRARLCHSDPKRKAYKLAPTQGAMRVHYEKCKISVEKLKADWKTYLGKKRHILKGRQIQQSLELTPAG